MAGSESGKTKRNEGILLKNNSNSDIMQTKKFSCSSSGIQKNGEPLT